MTVGEIIKSRRAELNLALEQVGKAVGAGKSTVKKWESGYIENMKRDKIALLARTLQLPPSSLISPDEIKLPEKKPAGGLGELTPHMVRHGYATILHEAGIDPKDAQELLGHANISTTLDIYTHISKKSHDETAKKLNEYAENTQ